MRVAHVSSGHPREELRVHLKQCNSLSAAGYEVFFVVADGEGDALINGVRILDVGMPAGRFQRMLLFPWLLLKRSLSVRASIYHFHDPELLTIALSLKRYGAKVIYDSHEDTPRSIMSRDWIPYLARWTVSVCYELFENFISRRMDCVVGATPFISSRFAQVGCRTVAINNFPLPAEISGVMPSRHRTPSICFLGGISLVRGVREIIVALGSLSIRMVLAGPFDNKDTRQELEQIFGWRNVEYRGVLERKQALAVMTECMIGMICYLPEPNHMQAYPNKLFEYMAAGLPVVASNFQLWREIVEDAQCGICVDPCSPAEIGFAIKRMLDDPEWCLRMGENGRRAVEEKYNWASEEKKLVGLYQEILATDAVFPAGVAVDRLTR